MVEATKGPRATKGPLQVTKGPFMRQKDQNGPFVTWESDKRPISHIYPSIHPSIYIYISPGAMCCKMIKYKMKWHDLHILNKPIRSMYSVKVFKLFIESSGLFHFDSSIWNPGAYVMWTLVGVCRSQGSRFEPSFLGQGCIFGKYSFAEGVFFFWST